MQKFSDWIEYIQNQEKKSCEVLFEEIIEKYKSYTPENSQNLEILEKAFHFAENIHKHQKRDSGVAYFTHPLIVTSLLQEYEVDEKILAAAIMHDAIEDSEEGGTDHEVKTLFGEEIYYLVDGVSKVSSNTKSDSHAETLQKIFSHSAHDARILLIKIADRIHNISTIGSKIGEEKRRKKIAETLQIFVLACDKLQLDHFKDTLLNACSYYLFPEKFQKIEEEVLEKSPESKKIFEKISTEIRSVHETAVVEYCAYPISNLLNRGDADIYNLKASDIFYVDVITASKEECYQALSWLSAKYNHKTALMSDLIANAPENSYRALKTSMVVDNAYLVRFHILSQKMKRDNEKGICNEIEKGNLTLSFFSQKKEASDTHNFVEILQHDMLSKKKAVHNSEKGQKFIPIDATALDAIIHFFPNKFIFLTKIFREGTEISFSERVSDNDILSAEFSLVPEASLFWIKYLKSSFGKVQLQNFLKKEVEFTKERSGKKILQQAFDVFKEGEISNILSKTPKVYESFFAKNKEELYVFIAEGMVSTKDVLLKYEEVKSQQQSVFGKFYQYFSGVFSEKIDKSMNISISSKTLSNCKLVQMVSDKSLENNVLAENISVQHTKTNKLHVLLSAKKREDLFSLFSVLKSQKEISSASFLPSFRFYMKMMLFFTLPFILNLIVFFYFIPDTLDFSPSTTLPVLVIFIMNTWGYSKLSYYFHILRKNSSFIISLFLINIGFLAVYFSLYIGDFFSLNSQNIFALAALFFVSLLPSLLLFVSSREKIEITKTEISQGEWEKKKKEKITGYVIRFLAVIIWGIQPLYIKYTETNSVELDLRIFLIALGVVLTSACILSFFLLYDKKRYWKPRLKMDPLFLVIILSSIVFYYFYNKSLLFTSSTNLIVFNNFAPLFALLVAIVLFRNQIPYLKDRSHLFSIIGIFLLGGLGSSLIFYHDYSFGEEGSIKGDIFALFAMFADIVLVVSQIRYAKYLKDGQSIFINIYSYSAIALLLLPFLLMHFDVFSSLSWSQILFSMGAGVLVAIGKILNFEAFRRMDGFIAFLMFNISILITFVVEAFILKEIFVTYLLVVGGALVIASSGLAEYINTKCEKRELSIVDAKK